MQRRTLAVAVAPGGIGLAAHADRAAAQAEQDAARAANTAFDAALSARDLAAVEALWGQDATVTAVHPRDRAPVVGWEAVRRSWQEVFARFAELSVAMPEPRIRVAGDTAVVVGLEGVRARAASSGNPVAFDAMTTNVFERRGAKWLMVHHHATTIAAA